MIRGNPSFDGFVEDYVWSLSAGNIVDFENDGGKESGLFRFFLELSFKDFANSVVWVDFFIEKVVCPAFEMLIRFDLQLLAMVSFGHIFHNSIKRKLNSLIKLFRVLDDWVSQNVHHVYITFELVPFDLVISIYDRHFLHSDVHQKVLLSERLYSEKSVIRKWFRIHCPSIPEGTLDVAFLQKHSICQHHHNWQNVLHLIKVAFHKFWHELWIESYFPSEYAENIVRLVNKFNVFDSFQIWLKIFYLVELDIILIELSILMMAAN